MFRIVRAAFVAAVLAALSLAPDASAATAHHAPSGVLVGHPTAQGAITHSVASRASASVGTTNWAGYQASVAGPQQIQASWFVPKATWPNRNGYSSTWVGLGGGRAGQGQLLQAGTESDVICTAVRRGRCISWRTQYFAWLETYPSRTQERVSNLPIAPGDAVEATVRWSASAHRAYFTLCNWRTNRCVGTSRPSSAPSAVAEAVVERPSGLDGRPRALANIGTVGISGVVVKGTAGARNLNRWPLTRMTMVNGATLATTGPIASYGDAFSVRYLRSA